MSVAVRGIEYHELTEHWTKSCTTCKTTFGAKSIDDMALFFYREKKRPDGFFYICKTCSKRKSTPQQNVRNNKRYKTSARYNFRYRARYLLWNALAAGKIIRPDNCEKCKKLCKPHGHHTDYGKPLDVMWLCQKCHLKEHNLI